MLADTLKDDIQQAYSRLLASKGFKPRACQKQMIAEIARTLAGVAGAGVAGAGAEGGSAHAGEGEAGAAGAGEGHPAPNICVVEAGTGTGKTLAYALAALPLARALEKKLVIATATVALQEQIVFRDLPDIREHSGLDFTFALAKGRRRYLCLARLEAAGQGQPLNQTLALGAEGEAEARADREPGKVEPGHQATREAMAAALAKGQWDGDRDNWQEAVEEPLWNRLSTDAVQCTGRRCSHYSNCCFYKAREDVHRVDCIVANHDLALADLVMGGGALLPPPEEAIYIFDEGHHLPQKAASHFSHFLGFHATRAWLAQLPASLKTAAADLGLEDIGPKVERQLQEMAQTLETVAQLLAQFQPEAVPSGRAEEGARYRFPLGQAPAELVDLARTLAQGWERLGGALSQFASQATGEIEKAIGRDREAAERWAGALAGAEARLEAGLGLWQSFAEAAPAAAPTAKWLGFVEGGQVAGMEIHLRSCPISVAEALQDKLWSRCFGGVVTSATLAVAGDFSDFQRRTGLAAESRFLALPSPFRWQEQARLRIPKMAAEPGQFDDHTRQVAELLPQLLADDLGALVLFTSWRQLERVHDGLPADFRERVLCQGQLPKQEMVRRHKAAVDKGEPSCIFGLASFAEGMDFPGAYCTHVVIAKLPFAVPDEPVAATLAEWVERQGGNAFAQISLPEAALRMAQMAGRLLRTETDEGQVTVLDRRLLTKGYGKRLRQALPPCRLVEG